MAVAARPQELGHHVVASVHIPYGRIIGKFEERRGTQARREMRVGDDAHAIRPGVRREDEIVLLRHQRDATQTRQAAHQRSVRLQHVEATLDDQIAELIEFPGHLAACDAHVDAFAQLAHAGAIAAMQRLLHPIDAEPLQLARDLNRILQRPRRVRVPRHAPALITIDHQLEPVAYSRTYRLQRLDVGAPVAAMKANFQRPEPMRDVTFGGVRESLGAAQRA